MSGFEPYFHMYKSHLSDGENSIANAIALISHHILISRGYYCYNGEEKSEMMPEDWNMVADGRIADRQYFKSANEQLIIKEEKEGDAIVLFIECVGDGRVFSEEFHGLDGTFLTGDFTNPSKAFNADLLIKVRCAIETLLNGAEAVESSNNSRRTNRQQPSPNQPPGCTGGHGQPENRAPPVADYGRSDLDPFHGVWMPGMGRGGPGGGGMVFDPMRGMQPRPDINSGIPQPLMPGAVPPGARFDPFGPPNPNRPNLQNLNYPGMEPFPQYDDPYGQMGRPQLPRPGGRGGGRGGGGFGGGFI